MLELLEKNDTQTGALPELYRSFREVFAAKHLRRRVIFWAEERMGKAVVRHVKNVERTQKSEDTLVGMTEKNIEAVKILIGNFVAGYKLSTIRWELYNDFALTDLAVQGRFDHVDLTGSLSAGDERELEDVGVVRTGDWDFDGIVATHICPLCRKIFDRSSFIYVPYRACETCGRVPTLDQSIDIVRKLLVGEQYGHKFEVHFVKKIHTLPQSGKAIVLDDAEELHNYLDPIPNSVMLWILKHVGTCTFTDALGWFEATAKELHTLYNRSLFRYVLVREVKENFRSQLENITETDCGIFTNAFVRVAERLDPGSMNEKSIGFEAEMVLKALPDVFNRLILNNQKS